MSCFWNNFFMLLAEASVAIEREKSRLERVKEDLRCELVDLVLSVGIKETKPDEYY
ncbi:3216_t:CDS:2 [Entrophospora sp. SA101]|nr:3216_t:CDS:2 [Entrophospora sp. SA101]